MADESTNEFQQMKGTRVTVELPGTDLPPADLDRLKKRIMLEAMQVVERLGTNWGGSCHGKAHCKMG